MNKFRTNFNHREWNVTYDGCDVPMLSVYGKDLLNTVCDYASNLTNEYLALKDEYNQLLSTLKEKD